MAKEILRPKHSLRFSAVAFATGRSQNRPRRLQVSFALDPLRPRVSMRRMKRGRKNAVWRQIGRQIIEINTKASAPILHSIRNSPATTTTRHLNQYIYHSSELYYLLHSFNPMSSPLCKFAIWTANTVGNDRRNKLGTSIHTHFPSS